MGAWLVEAFGSRRWTTFGDGMMEKEFNLVKYLSVLVLLILVSGCGNLRSAFSGASSTGEPYELLKKSPMSADSVVLEISMIEIPCTEMERIDRLFETLEMTRVELDQRQAWDRNGIRVGAGGTSLPMEFEAVVASELESEESAVSAEETKLAPRRRIQARSGKAFRIATRPVEPELTWFRIGRDGYREGGTRAAAQTEFEVRSFAEGDGSVRLILNPEILYGEPKQVVTTSNASFRYEMKRDSITFPDLRLEARLQLGESLILAAKPAGRKTDSMPGSFGLGQVFLQASEGSTKLIVIRLAQSQQDDLFDSSQNSQPLESIAEE